MRDEKRKKCSCLRTIARLCFVVLVGVRLHAQSPATTPPQPTPTVFWSQVDTYVGLTNALNFMMLASGSPGKYGDHPEFVLGPNLDIAVLDFLPRLKLNNPDKSKYLTFRIGYRYIKNLYGSETAQKNGVLELTPRIPLPGGFQIADRSRIDLRGLPTQFTWRYRNRLSVARSFEIRHFALTPYSESEIFYDCKTGEWTQYNYDFGVILRLTSKIELESWYKRQNTIVEPISSTNIVGLKLILFFRNLSNP